MNKTGKIIAIFFIVLVMGIIMPVMFGPMLYGQETGGDSGDPGDGSDTNECSGGGLNGSCGSEPSPDQIELNTAYALLNEALAKAAECQERMGYVAQYIMADLVEAREAVSKAEARVEAAMANNITEGQKGNGQTAGDPVLTTSGRYILEDVDISIPGMTFTFGRKYSSEGEIEGSLGLKWAFALDSRVLRGWTEVTVPEMEPIEHEMSELAGIVDEMTKIAEWTPQYPGTIPVKEQIDGVYESVKEPYDELVALNEEKKELYAHLRAMEARGILLKGLNGKAHFPGTPVWQEGTGNETLTLIDESGAPITFVPAEAGVWEPDNAALKGQIRLESLDGEGAETGAGFVLYGKGGTKHYYGGDGLLEHVEELGGWEAHIERDAQGKATKVTGPYGNAWEISYIGNYINLIEGPEGQTVEYQYNGNILASVKDVDDDQTQFSYSDGLLGRITKADGSYIEITYEEGAAGKLATGTSNEEGGKEEFYYFPEEKKTIHLNNSGVQTTYWYDEEHRTIREEYADGTIKKYEYNDLGQKSGEEINGDWTYYLYDTRSNIVRKDYSDGTAEEWAYDGNDQKTWRRDRDGLDSEWAYDGKGNCVKITLGGEIIFTATYNAESLMQTSRVGDRDTITYLYDNRGFLSERSTGSVSQAITEYYEYDSLGRLISYIDGSGCQWTYEYQKKATVETTPLGLKRTLTYNNRKDLVKSTETDLKTGESRVQLINYDKRHLPVKITDGTGDITEYEYRADGLLIAKRQGEWEWEYEYDAAGRIAQAKRTKAGSSEYFIETYTYALNGAEEIRQIATPISVTEYLYDAWGRMKSLTNALGEESERILSGGGRVMLEQGAFGGYYEYGYDDSGRVVESGRESDVAASVAYNLDGTIAEKTDRNGIKTEYEYDGRGLLAKEKSALGTIDYNYDEAGRLIHREIVNANSSGAAKYTASWEYNDAQRSVTMVEGGLYAQTRILNAWGEMVKIVDGVGNSRSFEYDGAGKLALGKDGYGNETKYAYNALGLLEAITLPNGNETIRGYNAVGKLEKVTDGEGTAWQGWYDEAGRLIREKGRPGIDKEYEYDAIGRMVEERNGGEVTAQYRYTNRGRETIFIDGNGVEYGQYKNAYGEPESEENRLSDTRGYEYDKEGRLIKTSGYSGKETSIIYEDQAGTTQTVYADGKVAEITRDMGGKVIRVKGETGIIKYEYDASGRLILETDEGAGKTLSYEYDSAGKRTRMLGAGRDTWYEYGNNGELLKVQDMAQSLSVEYTYNGNGWETSRKYGNGAVQEKQYDLAGRIIAITERTSGNQLPFRAEGYLYDEEGRREYSVDEAGKATRYIYDGQSRIMAVKYPYSTDIRDAARAEAEGSGLPIKPNTIQPETYTYSSQEQQKLKALLTLMGLTSVNLNAQGWTESYTYDLNGNIKSKATQWGTITYTYDDENRLLTKGSIQYQYDKDGNLVGETRNGEIVTYQYNGANRMIGAEIKDSKNGKLLSRSSYAYDGLGRRTITAVQGESASRAIYDMLGLEEVAGTVGSWNNGAWSESGMARAYIYGNGEIVAARYAQGNENGMISYLGKDVLGNVRGATHENANSQERYEYDVFGNACKGDLSGRMNIGYAGKEYDSATGLYNYGYRDYQPQTNRFTTVDPIMDGYNWYAYVNNDPVNWVDLWGLEVKDSKPTVILSDDEKYKIEHGVPITPIEVGLYTVTSGYGSRDAITVNGLTTSPFHSGIDMAAQQGTPVRSVLDGEVINVNLNDPIFGNNVTISHNNEGVPQTFIAHLDTVNVKEGDNVVGGQVVATVGSTGLSTGSHLHFEYQSDNGIPFNPGY